AEKAVGGPPRLADPPRREAIHSRLHRKRKHGSIRRWYWSTGTLVAQVIARIQRTLVSLESQIVDRSMGPYKAVAPPLKKASKRDWKAATDSLLRALSLPQTAKRSSR